jgi:hypothetical protein
MNEMLSPEQFEKEMRGRDPGGYRCLVGEYPRRRSKPAMPNADYVVSDLCRQMLLVAEWAISYAPTTQGTARILNVGSGATHPIAELIERRVRTDGA